MKILQLCCYSNHWGNGFNVDSIDIKTGKNVFDLDAKAGQNYDFILAAPPCTNFTKANRYRDENPENEISIAKHCIEICITSGKKFIIENPAGNIEKHIPLLKKYRIGVLRHDESNKEWVLYGNVLIMSPMIKRYGRKSITNLWKQKRLEYPKYFIDTLKNSLIE
jgi:site-specific DNA-cytosine methylase